jgi:RNA polymerase sigma factor (sigma-70 family)
MLLEAVIFSDSRQDHRDSFEPELGPAHPYCERHTNVMLSKRDLILCELLVLRCQQRDPQAARDLIARFERSLLYYLRRLVGSEADAWDAYQETWLTVFRTLKGLVDARAFPAFLYRVAHNQAVALLRKRHRLERPLTNQDEDVVNEPDFEFTLEDAAVVHAGLGKLTIAHREVLTLFFLQDLSISEISIVLGVPLGTVKSRLYHAKRSLKELLEKGTHYGPCRSKLS